jgi:diguanylate cyclase (GGDEF)-like protein
MPIRSFQSRLLFLLIAVLVLLEAGTLISVRIAGRRTLRGIVDEELRVGWRVFERVLENRASQLSNETRAVVSDFAFRQAIATDLDTVVSALENHGRRVEANVVGLVDLDGTVTADTVQGRLLGKPYPFPSMLRAAETSGQAASAIVTFEGRPYQFVLVPVLGPRTIAWVCAGFEIDEKVLADVRYLTSLEVSIVRDAAGRPGGRWISTLPEPARADLSGLDVQAPAESRQTLGGLEYGTLARSLRTADNSRVHVLLQRSLRDAQRPFDALELQITVLSLMILILAVIAAVWFARSVSRPMRVLAEGARRIERGDYVSRIVLRQHDEIGQLATAFNQMQTAIAAREEQIIFQATHDTLTGLPNRALFIERVAQTVAAARRRSSPQPVGMIMMDLDRFKDINDTLGHQFGDQLLIEIGHRLGRTVPANDTVARLGGDEFAVYFSSPGLAHATEFARQIGTAFDEPFVIGDLSVDVNASLGIALFPDHAADAETLMKRADVAMYDAKQSQSGFAVYDPGRDEHSLRRLSLMMDLRQAITNDELELFYQPKIRLDTEEVRHVEALVRWNHPRHKLMRPDEFIPLAEQSGKIGLITKWVIREAIAQCAAWRAQGLDLTVAVNLSAIDLFDSELPTFISGLLTEAGLPAQNLLLEITESAVMKDAAYAQKILADLKRRGVCLAIDDFGTGYSSLAHLKRLPVDELKIDKSFVLHLSESATDDVVIVRSTIELGHNMGLVVIAEGVETAESWDILKALGCDMAQGYYISRPLPVGEFTEWMAARRASA